MKRTSVTIVLLLAGTSVGCGPVGTPPPSLDAAAVTSAAPSAAVSPSPSASPTATPAPTPAPSATPAPWPTFTSTAFDYSIQYPTDWTVQGASEGTQDNFYSNDLYPSFGISGATKTMSMDEVVAGATTYYIDNYAAKLVSNAPIELADGYAGRILVFTGMVGEVRISIHVVLAAKDDVGYLFNWYGWRSDTDADKVLFEQVYSTWRSTRPASG